MADGLGNVDQQKLSDIVKGLHGRLRKQLREGKNCMGNPKTWNSENKIQKTKILRCIVCSCTDKVVCLLFRRK